MLTYLSLKKMKKGISIIISTFQVPKYLDECIKSIISQNVDFNYEIIIGIDGCQETLKHIKENLEIYGKTKIFYFKENSGPFVIKNNLIEKIKYKYTLFFDSDDIMGENMLNNFYSEIQNYDLVRFKFVEIVDGKTKGGLKLAQGVLGVKTKIFEKLNCFENWRCAADTEFLERMSHNNITEKIINEVSFYRRLHGTNLTIDSKTNFKSDLRNGYVSILNKKRSTNDWSNPEIIKKEYEKIKLNDEISST
jgi:glycosyltransferase involved in cell wall biosynthesis